MSGMRASTVALTTYAGAALDFGLAVTLRLQPKTLLSMLALFAPAVLYAVAFTPIVGASTPTQIARLTSTVVTAASIMFAVVVADEAVDRGAPRWTSYLIALCVGGAVGALSGWPLREALGLRFSFQGRAPEVAVATFAFYHRLDQFLSGVLLGGLATSVHVSRRTALAARRRQREAERARVLARRSMLESQLQSLQARVEPTFLFETLEHIGALYRSNADGANRMLEDLIGYLRAALPHLLESTSSVEQEATLARSWLDIVRRSSPGWHVAVRIDDAVNQARMPALVLLPLVQRAVHDVGPRDLVLHIALLHADGRLRIEVKTSTDAFATTVSAQAQLGQIEARLRALHGTEAHFEIQASASGSGSEARLEFPLESASTRDDRNGRSMP